VTSVAFESDVLRRVLVVGFATTGRSVAKVLAERGVQVIALDDDPDVVSSAGLEVECAVRMTPDADSLARLVDAADLVVVSPGVPPRHPVFSRRLGRKIVSELELASRMTRLPIVAVTGTNGKTTVANLVTSMLRYSGKRSVATGNIGIPLISVVERDDLDMLVAEVSSFQLALSPTFRPLVGTWLNFSPNHLDWHFSVDDYFESKARIWANQLKNDVAVANADDYAIVEAASRGPARLVTFGAMKGDYRLVGDTMVAPDGSVVAQASDLMRDHPHDRLNALAALATALEAGGNRDGVVKGLRGTRIPPHRLELVETIAGVAYIDDSKATTPAAVAAALMSVPSVVLILGGKNKGLDLAEIKEAAQRENAAELRGVVAVGESAEEIEEIFAEEYPVRRAETMADAVAVATSLAQAGDAVLLSPGCASFDWYSSYEARGDDFKDVVYRLARGAQR
jgi:UDP-N-acetylmuramoylalanine--D-glutamate ligase